MNSSNGRVAVVTGSSSGIGYETSLILARNGFTTFATIRDLGKKDQLASSASRENLPIHIEQLDVTDDSSVKSAVGRISAKAGRIDLLVNNAGYGLMGAFEDLSVDEVRA